MANIHALLDDLSPINDRIDGLVTGFQGAITIADTPTEKGIYIPTEAGVYPNAGGLEYAPEVDDEGFLVQFIFDGSEWEKNRVDVRTTLGVITEDNIWKEQIDYQYYKNLISSSDFSDISDWKLLQAGVGQITIPEVDGKSVLRIEQGKMYNRISVDEFQLNRPYAAALVVEDTDGSARVLVQQLIDNTTILSTDFEQEVNGFTVIKTPAFEMLPETEYIRIVIDTYGRRVDISNVYLGNSTNLGGKFVNTEAEEEEFVIKPDSVTFEMLSKSLNKYNVFDTFVQGKDDNFIVDFNQNRIIVSAVKIPIHDGNVTMSNENVDISNAGEVYISMKRHNGSLELISGFDNVDSSKNKVFGYLDSVRKTAFVLGNHTIIGGVNDNAEKDKRDLFNAVVVTNAIPYTFDFDNKKVFYDISITSYLANNGDVTVLNNSILPQDAEFDFSVYNSMFYLGYNRTSKKLIGYNFGQVKDINYEEDLIFAVVNILEKQVFFMGTGYKILGQEEGGGIDGRVRDQLFLGTPGGYYTADINDYYPIGNKNDLTEYMQEFEALRTLDPNYITREKLGTSVQGRDIYRYDFKPYITMNQITPQPKVLLTLSLHGVETFAHWSMLSFLKVLTEKAYESEHLAWVRNNIHLVVVPAVTPDGFANNTRNNANGIDINRNFPHGFNNEGMNPGDYGYPGTAPLTEIESQVLKDLVDEIKPFYMIDVHTNGTLEHTDDIVSISSGTDRMNKYVKGFGQSFDAFLRRTYPEIRDYARLDKYNLVMDRLTGTPGSFHYYGEAEGYDSSIIEITTGFGTEVNGEIAQKINREIIVNMLMDFLRFNNIYGNNIK